MDAKNDKLLMIDEPTNYIEAISDIDSEKWFEGMKFEMDFMYTNQVWTLVDPVERILIGCKWVFKRKTNMDENVQIYKVRMVVKGYRQKQGLDFDETFLGCQRL